MEGNLGAFPKPPHVASNEPASCCSACVEHCDAGEVGRRLDLRRPTNCVAKGLDVLTYVVGLVDPHVVDGGHQAQEVRLREVRAAVERMTVRREEDRHRPTATSAQCLNGVHVDRVDIRAFLAVDLDVDEPAVHLAGDLFVLEALVGHHVTPVAGRVADAQQDRDVPLGCRCECLRSPRVPIDRVVSMLPQVGRGLGGEPVGGHCFTVPAPPSATCSASRANLVGAIGYWEVRSPWMQSPFSEMITRPWSSCSSDSKRQEIVPMSRSAR